MKTEWVIGTRGSKLALKQTSIVIEKLKAHYPDYQFTVRTIKTTGDTVWDQPLHVIGGKGLFVKEIEDQLLDGRIDAAVHSVKDLPAELEEGLHLGAVLEREDPRDAFISLSFGSLSELVEGSRIGTGSLRRTTQLLHYNKGLKILPLRGNIDTRLKKLQTEGLDGIILAGAGIRRMGLEASITEMVPFDVMIPSCGQGAIGIEVREDSEAREILAPLNDAQTFQAISIERTLLKMIGGGCHLPLGIHVALDGNTFTLHISMGNEAGNLFIHESFRAGMEEAGTLLSHVYGKLRANLA